MCPPGWSAAVTGSVVARVGVVGALPNLAVERTSASSSAVYSDGLRGWPKPLTLKRWASLSSAKRVDHDRRGAYRRRVGVSEMVGIRALGGAFAGFVIGFVAGIILFLPTCFVAGVVTNDMRRGEAVAGLLNVLPFVGGAL